MEKFDCIINYNVFCNFINFMNSLLFPRIIPNISTAMGPLPPKLYERICNQRS